MTSVTLEVKTDEEKAEDLRIKLGNRRANLAAFYANVRSMIARSLDEDNPVVGLHGVQVLENGMSMYMSAGGTPPLNVIFSGLGGLQGMLIEGRFARVTGDMKGAQAGDEFDPATGKTHCVQCEDGDLTGDHAKHELEENAKAWLGLTCLVGRMFYGEHMPPEAKELLGKLIEFSLPADAQVS